MIGNRIIIKRGSRDEGEKPFWISFSDLMSALMVLFLVAMTVALLAVTKTVSDVEKAKAQREADITKLLQEVQQAASAFPGVTVDLNRHIIDFGDRARFDSRSNQLTSEQARLLRAFIPRVLAVVRDELASRWLKQIVVEGFTDQRGSYLYNLNLSLNRSQRVLCVLLATPFSDETPLTADEQEQIRDLFLVGGYSFNSAKASLEESRRVEMRLEFLDLDEQRSSTAGIPRGNFGSCSIG
ncbi:MAG: OmpA family protein [Nevskia sp.]|nr:OmpA family protein [Nevskia sp.]